MKILKPVLKDVISQCNRETIMGILELIAGAFIVSVPAFMLGDAIEERRGRPD